MSGRSRVEKTSGLRLNQFYFIEVHDLRGPQRPEASTLTIHWKEMKRERGWVLLQTQWQKTSRERKENPFTDTLQRTAALLSL